MKIILNFISKTFRFMRIFSLFLVALIIFLLLVLLWRDFIYLSLFNTELVNNGLIVLSSAVFIVATFSGLSFSATTGTTDARVREIFIKSGERFFYSTILLVLLLIIAFFFSNFVVHCHGNYFVVNAILIFISTQTFLLGLNALWSIGIAVYSLLDIFQKYDAIINPTDF